MSFGWPFWLFTNTSNANHYSSNVVDMGFCPCITKREATRACFCSTFHSLTSRFFSRMVAGESPLPQPKPKYNRKFKREKKHSNKQNQKSKKKKNPHKKPHKKTNRWVWIIPNIVLWRWELVKFNQFFLYQNPIWQFAYNESDFKNMSSFHPCNTFFYSVEIYQ